MGKKGKKDGRVAGMVRAAGKKEGAGMSNHQFELDRLTRDERREAEAASKARFAELWLAGPDTITEGDHARVMAEGTWRGRVEALEGLSNGD